MKTGPQFPQELRVGLRESLSTERTMQACLGAQISSRILRDLKILRNPCETDDRDVFGANTAQPAQGHVWGNSGYGTPGAARVGIWTTS